jgi:hypothetical protein
MGISNNSWGSLLSAKRLYFAPTIEPKKHLKRSGRGILYQVSITSRNTLGLFTIRCALYGSYRV